MLLTRLPPWNEFLSCLVKAGFFVPFRDTFEFFIWLAPQFFNRVVSAPPFPHTLRILVTNLTGLSLRAERDRLPLVTFTGIKGKSDQKNFQDVLFPTRQLKTIVRALNPDQYALCTAGFIFWFEIILELYPLVGW